MQENAFFPALSQAAFSSTAAGISYTALPSSRAQAFRSRSELGPRRWLTKAVTSGWSEGAGPRDKGAETPGAAGRDPLPARGFRCPLGEAPGGPGFVVPALPLPPPPPHNGRDPRAGPPCPPPPPTALPHPRPPIVSPPRGAKKMAAPLLSPPPLAGPGRTCGEAGRHVSEGRGLHAQVFLRGGGGEGGGG